MNPELGRKIIHILFGTALIFLIAFGVINAEILFYVLIFGALASLASTKFNLPILKRLIGKFGKKEEKIPGKGLLFFLAGAILVLQLFSLDIALASITILTFSDSLSYIVGKFNGRWKFRFNINKNLEGIIAGIIAGTLLASIFVRFEEAFIAASFAMIIEAIEIKISDENIDDNLLIPLVAGTSIFLLRKYFGI